MLFTLSPVAMEDGYGEAILPLADAKAHLRVEDDDSEDDLIAALRDASIDMVQQYTSLRLGRTEGIVATFEGFGRCMRMGVGPASTVEVTGVSYIDSAGAQVDLVAGEGWQVGVGGALLPAFGATWPMTGGKVIVTFSAGYEPGSCPPSLVSAAKLMLGHLYANREAVVSSGASGELPLGVTTLCNLYRMYS